MFPMLELSHPRPRTWSARISYRRVDRSVDDVGRATANLIINAPDVFAQHTHGRELHAADEKDEDRDGRNAQRIVVAVNDFERDHDQNAACAQGCDQEARPHHYLQWKGGKSKDSVEADLQ